MKVINQYYILSNGVKILKIGLGIWQVKDGDEVYNFVLIVFKNGYCYIDIVEGYWNEVFVGCVIKDLGIFCDEIFVIFKLELYIKMYEGVFEVFDKILKVFDFEYLDLFLIYVFWLWDEVGKECYEGNVLVYKVMEKLYKEGKIRVIGIFNFELVDIENIIIYCEIVLYVN